MRYSKLILFTLIAIVFTDSLRYIANMSRSNIRGSTLSTIFIFTSLAILIYFAYNAGFKNKETPKSIKNLIIIWLTWNMVSLVRGLFLATDYWDLKTILLGSLPFSLVPLAYFIGHNRTIAQTVFRFAIKILFPLGFLLIPLTWITNPELYSRIMVPVGLFIVFLPFMKYRWKVLVVIVALTSLLMCLSFRSNVIKITFSALILLIYYFKNYIPTRLIQLARLTLFVLPIVLFVLAIQGNYNIFSASNEKEGYVVKNSKGEEVSITVDTRTGLYVDILSTLNNTGNWILGEGAGGKYQTERFDYLGDGRGRYGSEVGILNILLKNGLVGVLIYFLLLYAVTGIAINQSNNILAKMLGLFIAFRWTFSFVEEFTSYDINFYFFWIAIGLVSSSQFRNMNDQEIKTFFELR